MDRPGGEAPGGAPGDHAQRKLLWLDADLEVVKEYVPPQGRFWIDFSVHPSGAATIVELEPASGADLFLKPFKAELTRFLADGSEVTVPLDSGIPDPGGPPPPLFSLDRARIAASGEDDLVVVRWSDNSVRAHRVEFRDGAFRPAWTTVVEPSAELLAIGIIGGGQLDRGPRRANSPELHPVSPTELSDQRRHDQDGPCRCGDAGPSSEKRGGGGPPRVGNPPNRVGP